MILIPSTYCDFVLFYLNAEGNIFSIYKCYFIWVKLRTNFFFFLSKWAAVRHFDDALNDLLIEGVLVSGLIVNDKG